MTLKLAGKYSGSSQDASNPLEQNQCEKNVASKAGGMAEVVKGLLPRLWVQS
jgi:hypothetical protein